MLEPDIAAALAQRGQRIVLTGAGGWIGLATLDMLEAALGREAFVSRVVAFGGTRRALALASGHSIEQRPLSEIAALDAQPTLVLHTAFLTKDRAEAMSESDYRAANEAISVLVLGALDRIGTEAVFLASSGAAARANDPSANAAMRLYGAMKREDEEQFARWAEARGRTAVICRIYAVAGPRINKLGAYALGSFITSALAGETITVRAPREVVRAYVALRELMSLVFALLLKPGSVTRFDSGGKPLELEAVARLVAAAVPGTAVARAQITASDPDIYYGDGASYALLLEHHGVTPVPLAQAIAETIEWLQADLRGSPAQPALQPN
ncbi:MAG: NAD(P)-dependent oxidoreductase [Sphingomonadales bacterium]|nr:NAD(P)-dependent oxidoreductase [Sphingomonadales bacterium]